MTQSTSLTLYFACDFDRVNISTIAQSTQSKL